MAEKEETPAARQETAPEPPEHAPRGNVHSAPEHGDHPGTPPPPQPN